MKSELIRLQQITEMGLDLRVQYLPEGSSTLDGEVVGNFILIYDSENPIEVLQHEFLDYLICLAIKPYQEICNCQRTMINTLFGRLEDQAYMEKEKVVEGLRELVFLA